jgi:hypothetical protein
MNIKASAGSDEELPRPEDLEPVPAARCRRKTELDRWLVVGHPPTPSISSLLLASSDHTKN